MIHPVRRLHIIVLVGLVAVLLGACSSRGASSPSSIVAPSPSPAAYVADVDVGGRTLHIVCVGPTDGSRPTVILESGLGTDYREWGDVLTGLKTTDRGCAYDRAGLGASPKASTPRTTDDEVTDLHALLGAAGIKPPYILVGHSIGGWNAMLFTARYPTEVVGAVLVDVRPPTASARWLAALPPETATEPDAVHQNRVEFTTFEHDPSQNPEGLDIATSATEAAAAPGFGSRPLAVLTAADNSDVWEGLDPTLAAKLDAIGKELQTGLVKLSSAGTPVIVTKTGHDIPGDRPDAVVDAIRSVLGAAR